MGEKFFLHGLDSSSKGTKGRWFTRHFPEMHIPDFRGELPARLQILEELCRGMDDITLVGSSFGGLMATCFAIRQPQRCHSLILLAPALNFTGYSPPPKPIVTPTTLIIGNLDTVTPPDRVIPLAEKSFANLQIRIVEDDHMLHNSFEKLDWQQLLRQKKR